MWVVSVQEMQLLLSVTAKDVVLHHEGLAANFVRGSSMEETLST